MQALPSPRRLPASLRALAASFIAGVPSEHSSRLNAEINAVRDGMHEAKLKKSGGGEAERLNLAIDGVSEREPDLPLAPMAANAMVGGPAGVSLSRLDDVTPAGGPADGVAAPADSAEDDFPPGVAIGAAAAEARAAAAIPLAGPPEERCSNPVDELARIRAKFARSAPEAPPPLVAPTPDGGDRRQPGCAGSRGLLWQVRH